MKKILSFLLVIIVSLLTVKPVSAASMSIDLYSPYVYLIDRETRITYLDEQSEEQIYPASMTKILTTIVAIEALENNDIDLDDTITMIEEDFAGLYEANASTASLVIGETVSYLDLLYGVLLPSGADACQALARVTYGSIEALVAAMNDKVASLGLENSHFENPTGLHDDNHYTTASDMAIILDDALNNETFKEVFTTRTYTSSNQSHTWLSTLARASSTSHVDTTVIDGAKSGYTNEAQYTLASLMTIDHHEMILVTAYASTDILDAHVLDALTVYDYMNDNFHAITLYKKDDELEDYIIIGSQKISYTYISQEDISLLLDKNISYEDLTILLDGESSIMMAPLEEGETILTLTVSYDDEMIYTYDFVLDSSISLSYPILILEIGIPVVIFIGIILIIFRKYRSR